MQDWVLASLECGSWAKEEPYEMVSFSPAVRNIRLEKEATHGDFKSELFRGKIVQIMKFNESIKQTFTFCVFQT